MKTIINIGVFALILMSCQSFGVKYAEGVTALGPEAVPPELTELLQSLPLEEVAASEDIVRRWQSWMKDKTIPIVRGNMVTFIYYSFENPVEKVSLSAPINNQSDKDFLYRYGKSRLFYKTYTVAEPGLMEYFFYIYEQEIPRVALDSLNPVMTPGKPRRSVLGQDESEKGFVTFFPGPPVQSAMAIRPREVTVYTPPFYNTRPSLRYPVLYMQDGQNIWEGEGLPYGGWKLNTVADSLIREGKMEPVIIVGVANSSRRAEEYVGGSVFYKMTPTLEQGFIDQAKRYHEEFRRYLAEVVKPYIDSKYRTLPDRNNTAIGGSSFGAGVSLSTAFSYPQIYSKVAALSGGNYKPGDSQWEAKPYNMYPWLIETLVKRGESMKIWLDCGTENVDALFLPRSLEMRNALIGLGWREGVDMRWVQDNGAGHNEMAWAERAPDVFKFLFPK